MDGGKRHNRNNAGSRDNRDNRDNNNSGGGGGGNNNKDLPQMRRDRDNRGGSEGRTQDRDRQDRDRNSDRNNNDRNSDRPSDRSDRGDRNDQRSERRAMREGYAPGVSPPTLPSSQNKAGNEPPDPSHVFPSAPYKQTADLYMNRNLAQHYSTNISLGPPKLTTVASPKFQHYLSIINVENVALECPVTNGLRTQVYRTTNRYNGKMVALRRIICQNPKPQEECTEVMNQLKHFRHPNLVPLHTITATDEFVLGSQDIIVEYRYVKGVESLRARFADQVCPEATIWSIACQLMGLIKFFHDSDTALRCIEPTKILFQDINQRVIFSGLGIVELTEPRAHRPSLENCQRKDVQDLGSLIILLATRWQPQALDGLVRAGVVSNSLRSLITACREGTKIADLARAFADRLVNEIAFQEGFVDVFHNEGAKEVHNGRIMRLLIKLNFVLAANDSEWNEQIAPLKLFYIFLFNQVDDQNRPQTDWGHVYSNLNKFDAGSDEMVQLMTNDGSALLVVSFKELKQLANNLFDALNDTSQQNNLPQRL